MRRCKNCDTGLEGQFCPACGQKDIDLGRPFFDLFSEAIREAIDLDGRAWRTLKTLFLAPGRLTGEFLAGKRQTYTSPLRLYLFISVSFFVLLAWIASRGLLLEQGQTVEGDAAEQARFMSDLMPRLMFLLLPVFALLLKAVFRQRLYFDHLIHSVHLHCAAYIILAVMLPVEKLASENFAALALQVAALVYFVVYLLLSIKRVYAISWLAAAGRSAAVLFGYLIVFSMLVEGTSSFLIISD
ncbi:MAG: DUF3667 domain-containing protein [Woeseiaceae bacterium]